jgi:gamma interferon inducible lysosomal thiol reductase (GILT)
MRSTIVTILLLAAGCENASKLDPSIAPPVARTVDKPAKLDFYVMSKCPYGVQVEKAVAPVLAQLGGNVDLHISYIGDAQGDQLSSMHGPTEVAGDIAQLCAREVAPARYFKMIECQDNDPAHVDTNWESCGESAGIDTGAVKACIAGKGKQLLAASFADARQRGASASPTIYLNGQAYKGGRKTKDLLRAVCTSFDGAKPEACASLPAPVAVNATFFSDARCKDCNIDALEGRLRQMFEGLVVKKVDYMTPEGKALYADLKLTSLPVILFDRTLDADKDAKQQIARYLKPAGSYQALALGGHFDPTAEICDNQVDDDGNGKSDCDDATCKEALACRPEVKKSLDLFVMSHCPFGTKAMLAAKEFADAFGKDATVAVHFIGDSDNGKLTSMHGPDEVTDDLREVCAIEHYGKDQKFLDFLACRSKDLTADWKACTGANGIDAAVIESCVAGEGPGLLTASFGVAEKLDFHASPTYLVNNRAMIDARDAAGIQAGFCKANPGLPGCARQLTATAPAQQTKGAAACK